MLVEGNFRLADRFTATRSVYPPSLCERIWTPEFNCGSQLDIKVSFFKVAVKFVSAKKRIRTACLLVSPRTQSPSTRYVAVPFRCLPTVQVLAIEEIDETRNSGEALRRTIPKRSIERKKKHACEIPQGGGTSTVNRISHPKHSSKQVGNRRTLIVSHYFD